MANQKIIAVVGATGAQGGGLARAILKDPGRQFAARAVTRNAGSDKARALAAQGAEVVEADLDDRSSLEAAFAGAHGAYCVTNFWEHFSPDKERQQAENLALAARAAGLQHVIWSTLEDTRHWVPLDDDRMPTLMEHYKVPHFDAKGEANALFEKAGVPTTLLLTSFYWDNLIYFGSGPTRGEDGARYIGRTVGIAGEHLTGAEMAAALSDALGEEVRYNAVTPEAYRGFDFPGAADLGNMFQFKRDFEDYFCGARNPDESRALNPALLTFRQWLAKNAHLIPLDPDR